MCKGAMMVGQKQRAKRVGVRGTRGLITFGLAG